MKHKNSVEAVFVIYCKTALRRAHKVYGDNAYSSRQHGFGRYIKLHRTNRAGMIMLHDSKFPLCSTLLFSGPSNVVPPDKGLI